MPKKEPEGSVVPGGTSFMPLPAGMTKMPMPMPKPQAAQKKSVPEDTSKLSMEEVMMRMQQNGQKKLEE